MDDFEKQAMLLSLKKMFDGTHFSICVIDKLIKSLGVRKTKSYQALNILHCVDWSDMPDGYKEQVFAKTMELLDSPDCSFDEMLKDRALAIAEADACVSGFLKRLKS